MQYADSSFIQNKATVQNKATESGSQKEPKLNQLTSTTKSCGTVRLARQPLSSYPGEHGYFPAGRHDFGVGGAGGRTSPPNSGAVRFWSHEAPIQHWPEVPRPPVSCQIVAPFAQAAARQVSGVLTPGAGASVSPRHCTPTTDLGNGGHGAGSGWPAGGVAGAGGGVSCRHANAWVPIPSFEA